MEADVVSCWHMDCGTGVCMLDFLRRLFQTKQTSESPVQEQDPRVILARGQATLERELARAEESLRAVEAMKRDLALRLERVTEDASRYRRQAERAVAVGREDIAREALTLREESERQRSELERSIAEIEGQRATLETARDRFRQQVEALRARRAEMGARLAAAEAELRLREVMAAIPSDVAAIAQALDRVEERMEAARARAGALEELSPSGTATISHGEALEQEIVKSERAQRVERELERIRGEALAAKGRIGAEEGKERDEKK